MAGLLHEGRFPSRSIRCDCAPATFESSHSAALNSLPAAPDHPSETRMTSCSCDPNAAGKLVCRSSC
ncbi:MAG: hypothetical protein ACJA07_002545 [Rhodococcus sp. (in: high G+C Gram-positive bacteria)]|jgi:hypothetical protein